MVSASVAAAGLAGICCVAGLLLLAATCCVAGRLLWGVICCACGWGPAHAAAQRRLGPGRGPAAASGPLASVTCSCSCCAALHGCWAGVC